jgi:ribosomal protein S18 acetylase RimI-like enzyme
MLKKVYNLRKRPTSRASEGKINLDQGISELPIKRSKRKSDAKDADKMVDDMKVVAKEKSKRQNGQKKVKETENDAEKNENFERTNLVKVLKEEYMPSNEDMAIENVEKNKEGNQEVVVEERAEKMEAKEEKTEIEDEREKILSKVVIRNIEIDDLAKVWQLGEELYDEHHWPNLYRTWDSYSVTELFSSDPEYSFVADYKDEVIGFVLGTTVAKASWKYGYVTWLGVAKRFQRFGIARKLYNEIENVLKKDGVKIIIVDTQADNLPALKFFEKIGFRNPQKCVYLSRDLLVTPNIQNITSSPLPAGVIIRPMVLQDVAAVYHLGEQIFTATRAQSHYRSWDEYTVVEFFNTDEEYCFVAEMKGKVVAFVLGCVIKKARVKNGYITWIGVKEKMRRRGIGTALYYHICRVMAEEGVTNLLVDTEAENKAALNFFDKRKFSNPVSHIFLDHNICQKKDLETGD